MGISDAIDAWGLYAIICLVISTIIAMIWAGIQTWKDRHEITYCQ